MRRFRVIAALVAALALTLSASALAASKFTKITGGSTTVTPTAAALTALQNAHLTVTPIAPATASGGTFTFPIARGRVNLANLHGVITHRGGIKVSNGTKSGSVRALTIVANGKTAGLYGAVRRSVRGRCHLAGGPRHRHLRCRFVVRWTAIKLAKITGVTVSGSSATGQAQLTAQSAALLNRLAGGSTFAAGQVLGTVKVSPTFA